MDDRRTNTQRDSIAYQRRDAQKPAANQFSMKAISRRATVFHSKGARRLFSTAWAFALLALATFSASAQTPTLAVSPTSVKVGDLVTVTGASYTANQGVGQLSVAGTPIETGAHLLSATVGTVSGNNITANASGAFTVTFRAPATTGGEKTVNLTGSTATGTYDVIPRIVRFSPLSVKFGDRMTIVADGFTKDQEVEVRFGGATYADGHVQSKIKANGNGQINGQIDVKAAPYADGTSSHPLHKLWVGADVSRDTAVGVSPYLKPGAQTVKGGGKIKILAHGFPAGAVTLDVGRDITSFATANAAGSIQDGDDVNKAAEIDLPAVSFGRRDLVLKSGNAVSRITNGLSVEPSLSVGTKNTAGVGDDFSLTLEGFAHYKAVNSVNVIQTDNTGTHREAVTLDLVQNGSVVAANVMTIDAFPSDPNSQTPIGDGINGDTGSITGETYTLSAANASALRSGVATLRATGALSRMSQDVVFFYSSPADSPRLFVVEKADSTTMITSAAPGGTIELVGTSYPVSASAGALSMVRGGQSKAPGVTVTADADGLFSVSATIPTDIAGGVWTLAFANSPTATATINIVPSKPDVTPKSTTVGTELTLSGSGFLAGETVTLSVGSTTSVRVTDGSNTDGDTKIGAVSTTVRLGPTPYGKHKVMAAHARGSTEGAELSVQSKITRVDGLSRDRTGAPADERVTKRLGDGLTIVGTGQAASSELQLWLDANRSGGKNDGDIHLNTNKATSNANGSYSIAADLTSVNVDNLTHEYRVFLVDPTAKTTQPVPVLVKFDSSFVRPIAAHVTSVKSKDPVNKLWIQGIAYNQNGQPAPGKNLGYLLLDGAQQNLGGTAAADMFNEGGSFDKDPSSGGFRIEINTPELSKGQHSLSLGGQTVYFTVNERWEGANKSLKIGESHKLTVYGFGANESIQIKMAGQVVRTASTNASGTAKDVSFTVPSNITGGDYKVSVESGSVKKIDTLTITVIPSIAFKGDDDKETGEAHGTTQDTVTVTGKGFRKGEGITFTFGGYSVGVTVTANSNGAFEQLLRVPSASYNRDGVEFRAVGNASLAHATATFHIFADLRLADTQELQVGSGTVADVVGDGFASGDTIKFTISGKDATSSPSTVTAGPNGSFTASLTMPESQGGIQTIKAEATNGSRQIEHLPVNVSPSLQVITNPASGTVGTWLTVKARGFENNKRVKFFVTHPSLGTVNASTHGDDHKANRNLVGKNTGWNGSTDNVRVQIPTLPRGTWTLVVQQDGTNDPLTNAPRQATADISVTPRITHIEGEGNQGKWPKAVTVRNADDSFRTFRVQGNGFEAGSALSVYHTNASGDEFTITSGGAVNANGTFDLRAQLEDSAHGPFKLYVADSKGGVATAKDAIRVGPVIFVSKTSVLRVPDPNDTEKNKIQITGSGFAAGAVTFRFKSGENMFTGTSSTTVIVGQKVVAFKGALNPLAPSGWQTIVATDSTGATAEKNILVATEPGIRLTLNRTAAHVGDEVEATGTGYVANTSYPALFGGNPVTITSATVGHLPTNKTYIRTDGNGAFRFKAKLPNATKGTQQPFRVGANHAVAPIQVTEKVWLSGSLNGVQEGASFTVNGSGFAPGETLALVLAIEGNPPNPLYFYTQSGGTRNEVTTRVKLNGGADVGSVIWDGNANRGPGFRARSNGSFSVTMESPGIPLGKYRVDVFKMNTSKGGAITSTGSLRARSSNTFTSSVKAVLAVSSSTVYNQSTGVGGNNNGQLFISGTGFKAGQNVTVSLPGWSQNVTPDADGFVNTTVTVTGAQYGNHEISAASNGVDHNTFKKHGYHDAKLKVNVASEIVVVPSTASPGQTVTIHGFGFGNDNRANKNDEQVRFRANGLDIGSAKGIVGSHGRFLFNYRLPNAIKAGKNLTGVPGGTIVVRAEGHSTGGAGAAEDSLTIIPVAKIKNTSVEIGGDIQIEGYGFPAGAAVQLYLDQSANGSGVYELGIAPSGTENKANARGGLEAKVTSKAFVNPHIARHVRWQVQGTDANTAVGAGNTTNTYVAKPSITVDPYTGRGTEDIQVVGKGFTPGSALSVKVGANWAAGTSAFWQNVTVGTINGGGASLTPANTGDFIARFNAPTAASPGKTKVHVGSASSIASKDFIYSSPTGTKMLEAFDGKSGAPGTTVKLRGWNYGSFESVGLLRIDNSAPTNSSPLIRDAVKLGGDSRGWQAIGGYITADVNGVFEVSFKTPQYTAVSTNGTKYINTQNGAAPTSATVTITSTLARSPRVVSPGSTVTFTGSGFGANQNLGKATVVGFGQLGKEIKADANGVVTGATFKIPDEKNSDGTFKNANVYNRNINITSPSLSGGNDKKDLHLRNAEEIIYFSPTSGGSGTVVRVKARGFFANWQVEVQFDGKHVSPYDVLSGKVHGGHYVTASAAGDLDFYFNVPPSDSGAREFWVRQYQHGDRNKNHRTKQHKRTFMVGAIIAVRPLSREVGEDLTVTGTGFGANQALTVNVGGTVIQKNGIDRTFKANGDGTFNAKFKVPEVQGGLQTVTVGSASFRSLMVNPNYTLSGVRAKVDDPSTPLIARVDDPSTPLTVTGYGMEAGTSVMIYLDNDDKDRQKSPPLQVGSNGTVSWTFPTIAATSSDRSYTATLVDSGGNRHDAGTWHVVSTATAATETTQSGKLFGNSGDVVTLSAKGFSRYERVRALFGSVKNGIVTGISAIDGEGIPVDENGTLGETKVRVPNLAPGATKLILVGQALNSQGKLNLHQWDFAVGSETKDVLTVAPAINGGKPISEASPGDRIRVYINVVNTFQPNEAVTVYYDYDPVNKTGALSQTTTADPNGSIPAVRAVSFTVPGGPGGMKTIGAVGAKSGAERKAEFTVIPKVTLLNPSQFDLGDQVTIDGVGAGANQPLQVEIATAKDNNAADGSGAVSTVTIDSGATSGADGRFKVTFRVLNALYTKNPQPVRIRVKSGSELTSPWFGRAAKLQVVTKGVRVALRPAAEGPGDAVLTLEGTAADSGGNSRILENIGNVELAHGSINNGQRRKMKYENLTVLDGIGTREKDAGGFATIRTDSNGRFKVRVNLTSLNGGKPVPSGLVTIYVGGELVTTSYTVTPQLRLTDADDKAVAQVKLGQDYTLKGISFSRSRAVTLTLGGKSATALDVKTDNNGEFTATMNWAAGGWVGGVKKLTAATLYDDAELDLTVLGSITDVEAGTAVKVGDKVDVSGNGFGAEEALTITVGGNPAEATEGGTTNADGTFTATIAIPDSSSGAKDLRVSSDTSSATVTGAYAIGTSLSAKMTKADTATVAGTGYPAGNVTIMVAGEADAAATAGANGSFTAEIALTADRDHGSSVAVTAGSQTASFLYDDTAEAQNIAVSPNPAGSGKTVTVSAEIEAGSTAMFSVAGVDGASGDLEAVEGGDAPDGFTAVAGMYAVEDSVNVADAVVTVTVTDSIDNETMYDNMSEMKVPTLTIDTIAPIGTAALSSETTRNNLSFTITATSEESGLTAAADVSAVDSTKVDPVALAESDEGGSYSADVVVSGKNEATPGDKTVVVTLTDAAGNSASIEVGIELRANTAFTVKLYPGLNLIHVPVSEEGLDRASALWEKINKSGNGGNIINAIVMLKYADSPGGTPKFVSYTGGLVGSAVDLPLEDSTGVLVLMKQAASVTFTGGPLEASVPLRSGINLIGVPRDSDDVSMASHIAALGQPDVAIQTLALKRDDDGNVQFIAATPSNDVAVTGGQGFIVVASGPWALTMPGAPWENAAAPSTAASAEHLLPTSTPLLVVEGSLAREDTLAALNGLEVSVTNLRTGQKATERVGSTSGNGRFSAAMIDLKGGRYEASDQFEVQVVDPSGVFGGFPARRIVFDEKSVVSGRVDLGQLLLSAVPDYSALLPNYPNPFNPETWIPFQLAESSRVTVTVYNAAGQTVRVLELGQLPAGTYHSRSKAAYWDGRNALGERVASGLYFYRIEAGSFSQLRRMVILK